MSDNKSILEVSIGDKDIVHITIGGAITAEDLSRLSEWKGKIIPGAYIKHNIDLIAEGLAWRPDIRKVSRYRDLSNELRDLFQTL
jgi:hypothetical protein